MKKFLGYIYKQKIMADLISKNPIPFEPKFENRFIVTLPKKFGIDPYFVQSMNRPTYNLKKKSWENIKIEFVDPIGPSVSDKLFDLCQKKVKKFDIEVKTLDPTGVSIETWSIKDCKIVEIDFGNWKYYKIKEKDTIIIPAMTVNPKKCILL